jgi:hypothetical protein
MKIKNLLFAKHVPNHLHGRELLKTIPEQFMKIFYNVQLP